MFNQTFWLLNLYQGVIIPTGVNIVKNYGRNLQMLVMSKGVCPSVHSRALQPSLEFGNEAQVKHLSAVLC